MSQARIVFDSAIRVSMVAECGASKDDAICGVNTYAKILPGVFFTKFIDNINHEKICGGNIWRGREFDLFLHL